MVLAWTLVALVALQRLAELVLARRNGRRLRAAGAVEAGRRHYPLFIVLHAAWLVVTAAGIDAATRVDPWLLAAFLLVEAGRVWVVASLGRYWTTRILTIPDAPLVSRGPYRWFRHPNYLIVTLEIALLPLALGAWETAVVFSVLNAILLFHRIRIEDGALGPRRTIGGSG